MCYEGLTAAHSFHERILKTQFEKFKAWKPKLDELKRERWLTGQKLDNALVDYLLGDDEKPPAGAAIELVGHYIGQLVYQLLLISPRQIVIGGHMARPRVVDEVRKIVRISAGDYPARPELTESGLKRHIVPSRARPHERYTVEIRGALEIALSRAKTKLSDQAVARS
jgi:hypothetical protein